MLMSPSLMDVRVTGRARPPYPEAHSGPHLTLLPTARRRVHCPVTSKRFRGKAEVRPLIQGAVQYNRGAARPGRRRSITCTTSSGAGGGGAEEGYQVCGVSVPGARASAASRALDGVEWPAAFPYSEADLTPEWAGSDQAFYILPKFAHHAGEECRAALTGFYEAVLPAPGAGAVLDLCSSFTSHYPATWRGRRCAVIGLNPLELLANPSKTEWRIQNLNEVPALPYEDASFDLITNSLSVDYLTRPLEVFAEMGRVLKPGGLACMAFTNRCFPTKVVPIWTRPFTEEHHARVVASYFQFCPGTEWEVGVVDVSPAGWAGQRDPMIVVMGRKVA